MIKASLRRVLHAVASAFRRTPRPAPVARAYTDRELLARTEEFNRAAEAHWKFMAGERAGRRDLLSKPLAILPDAPGLLYRLGLVLGELHLGAGHVVLDLGAGSCWVASYLNRLRCRTIAVDVSPTALELGRELFGLDARQRLDLEPQFLVYDGHRLPLPDESVDRVVCFDSFHHVPNQEEILSEVYRVLRPGGRAVFGEPGEGHSHAAQSVFETDQYGVLENELDLRDVERKARQAGFGEMVVKPYPEHDALALTLSEYQRFIDGEDAVFPVDVLKASLRHFYVFTLAKGGEVLDSRYPGMLRAEISLPPGLHGLRGVAGAEVTFPVRVRNTGDTLWLHEQTPFGGYVMLGGNLHRDDASRDLLERNVSRALLPRSLPPGEAADLTASVRLPREPGRYRLRLDMMDEWIAWFGQRGSPVVELEVVVEGWADSRQAVGLEARLDLRRPPQCVTKPGALLALPVRARNAGYAVWSAATPDGVGAVGLGGHLFEGDRLLEFDLFRAPLGKDVAPGEEVEVEGRFRAPALPGRYRVCVDLVAHGVAWFAPEGGTPEIALEVLDEPTDSASPGVLRARIEAGSSALAATPGSSLRLAVRVTNEGNTVWLERMPEGLNAGQVRLGARLLSAAGEVVETDFLRAPLPRAIAPGESADLVFDFAAPGAPGRYLLELDMVDEGICWFGSRGSPTLRMTIDCA